MSALRDWKIDASKKHEPGSPPPKGYVDWHEWAAVQSKAGLKQQQCGVCCLWGFPQELVAGMRLETVATTAKGKKVRMFSPVCLKCEAVGKKLIAESQPTDKPPTL